MKTSNCSYCGRTLNLFELVVSCDGDKLFCASEQAPLEPNSCALKYIEDHKEEAGKNYFFIKLEKENK